MQPIRLIQAMILILSLLKAFGMITGAEAHGAEAYRSHRDHMEVASLPASAAVTTMATKSGAAQPLDLSAGTWGHMPSTTQMATQFEDMACAYSMTASGPCRRAGQVDGTRATLREEQSVESARASYGWSLRVEYAK